MTVEEIQTETNATIIAVSREGKIHSYPLPKVCADTTYTLIAIGSTEQLEKLHKILIVK